MSHTKSHRDLKRALEKSPKTNTLYSPSWAQQRAAQQRSAALSMARLLFLGLFLGLFSWAFFHYLHALGALGGVTWRSGLFVASGGSPGSAAPPRLLSLALACSACGSCSSRSLFVLIGLISLNRPLFVATHSSFVQDLSLTCAQPPRK